MYNKVKKNNDATYGECIMSKNDSTNFVLHAKSDQFYWEGIGQLSIKTFWVFLPIPPRKGGIRSTSLKD